MAKATRRRFTPEYKRKSVREADACKTPGAIGALLRREGLYSSHLTTWRAARERPDFPARIGSIQDARAHCHVFFPWYNTEPPHAGLGLLTPFDVHHGLAEQRVARTGDRARRSLCRAPGTIPRRPTPSGGAACGGVDQSAQSLAGLAGRSACPAGRLGLACRRSLRRGRQGQADASPGKAPEG
jgi:hypothetical protein